MPRDRYREDDEGEGDGHGGPRRRTSPAVIILVAIGGVSLLRLVACAGIGRLGF